MEASFFVGEAALKQISDLIRVAVTRDIGQAIPVSGTFVGRPDEYPAMTVDVTVTSQ